MSRVEVIPAELLVELATLRTFGEVKIELVLAFCSLTADVGTPVGVPQFGAWSAVVDTFGHVADHATGLLEVRVLLELARRRLLGVLDTEERDLHLLMFGHIL